GPIRLKWDGFVALCPVPRKNRRPGTDFSPTGILKEYGQTFGQSHGRFKISPNGGSRIHQRSHQFWFLGCDVYDLRRSAPAVSEYRFLYFTGTGARAVLAASARSGQPDGEQPFLRREIGTRLPAARGAVGGSDHC